MKEAYCTAIVLAAGKGSRMGTEVHKQYLPLAGRPVLAYSLQVFQDSPLIDEIILVAGAGEEDYCRRQFVEKYGLTKLRRILPGGRERYDSVWCGLKAAREGYVFIHDGARPFVDEEILARAYEQVRMEGACVVGMPVKDTIKVADDAERVADTPDRGRLWMIQTPQVFETALVRRAYAMLLEPESSSGVERDSVNRKKEISVTDDAMVVEQMLGHPVKLVRGSYENIKITTPEDLELGEIIARRRKGTAGPRESR